MIGGVSTGGDAKVGGGAAGGVAAPAAGGVNSTG
jgi:hypothetical protein